MTPSGMTLPGCAFPAQQTCSGTGAGHSTAPTKQYANKKVR